jgi:molybdopterin-containing oxidoreductase family iron-sulfur binding subunit
MTLEMTPPSASPSDPPGAPGEQPGLDLAALRARLAQGAGPDFWRSLDELAQTPEFAEALHQEFPTQASEWADPVGRREFLKLMGASLALAGLAGCTSQPSDKIVPYVKAPEEVIPGKPLFFATTLTLGGYGVGVLVESHTGRPTKIEGNPSHPASLGSTDAFTQAAILSLYDPDRSQVVTQSGQVSTWPAFIAALAVPLEAQKKRQGAGLRILTETVTSPTLTWQLRAVLARFPAARWHQYEPVGRDAVRAGAQLAFGEVVNTVYRFDKAEVVLALDADFLASGPGSVRYARDFAAKRTLRGADGSMNRLYAVETAPTPTGAAADHRLGLRPSEMEGFTRALARALGVEGVGAADPDPHAVWVAAVAKDLKQHAGACVVVAGEQQPPLVHALAHAMNRVLGNVGRTVVHTDPVEANPVDQLASLQALTADMQAGRVELLLILGGNPVYTAPADVLFAEALQKVPLRIHLGLSEDETSAFCQWHVPEAHALEAWSDARAFDGTLSLAQPLIAPLFGGRSAHELLSVLVDGSARSGYEILREYWQTQLKGGPFEAQWRTALHDGVVPGTALPSRVPAMRLTVPAPKPGGGPQGTLEVAFRPDPTVWDGRFANNGWLQELPRPISKLTWDNAALLSPASAQRLGLANGDAVELALGGRKLTAPVWIVPGHADEAVTLCLGSGRTRAGRVGTGVGFNAGLLRSAAAPWGAPGCTARKTGEQRPLATTQHTSLMEGRHLVRSASLAEFRKHPEFARALGHGPAPDMSFYPEFPSEPNAWAMVVDLTACTGCGACVVACQAENNVPVVGKAEVQRGRAMHWIRIDCYYEGGLDAPEIHHQPVACMHCEKAPCEPVCPVGATVHSGEGLNDMVYNRCVGTRYCSNNCPYKVRRFNFLQYADVETPSRTLQYNPNVTVRSRGVMEKCTYCVQRINAARIAAKREDREIRDGEVVTACQAACPTQAITFGNLKDAKSRVAALKADPRSYGLLSDLNTRPRTSYLARVRNVNPELEKA